MEVAANLNRKELYAPNNKQAEKNKNRKATMAIRGPWPGEEEQKIKTGGQ